MFQKGARRFHATKRAGFETKVQVCAGDINARWRRYFAEDVETGRAAGARSGEDSAGQAYWLPV
jgi:hypothetical protein